MYTLKNQLLCALTLIKNQTDMTLVKAEKGMFPYKMAICSDDTEH